ncbi:MAG: membrane lipoprotein lipid attachment site-containing protein [Bacteroidales bacterium]|nr:membrane lipoprotein lipid attachment site-containing protein [Bacteroidales bacterium]
MKKILIIAAAVLLLASCQDKKVLDADPAAYDFTEVITTGTPFDLGIIGDDFTRLQIHYASVTKTDAEHYAVKGFSKAGETVQPFEGTMEIASIYKIKPNPDEPTEEIDPDAYELVCNYVFTQPDGKFEGKAVNDILLKGGKASTDDSFLGADGYSNNQHIGTFTSTDGVKKIANWGDWRIPESGDLDQGVGEFIPSEKYHSKGWASYYNALYASDEVEKENAMFAESRKWWDPEAPVLTAQGPRNLMDNPMKQYEPDTYFVEATTPKGPTTIIFPTTDAPEYTDINFDGYPDLFQMCDDGYCYLYDPQLKEFGGCPSYNSIKYKGYIQIYPEGQYITTSNYDLYTGKHFFCMYKYDSDKGFYPIGSITEKDGAWEEFDQDGNKVKDASTPAELSQVWKDYIDRTMAQY